MDHYSQHQNPPNVAQQASQQQQQHPPPPVYDTSALGHYGASAAIAAGGHVASPHIYTGAFANVPQGLTGQYRDILITFWQQMINSLETEDHDYKSHQLPLARIKKVMKADPEVKMISAEAPILFAKGCDIFITEVTMRAWIHAEENKRRTLQRSDIANALAKSDMFDFLIDIVPREEAVAHAKRSGVGSTSGPSGSVSGPSSTNPSTTTQQQPPTQQSQQTSQQQSQHMPSQQQSQHPSMQGHPDYAMGTIPQQDNYTHYQQNPGQPTYSQDGSLSYGIDPLYGYPNMSQPLPQQVFILFSFLLFLVTSFTSFPFFPPTNSSLCTKHFFSNCFFSDAIP